MFGVDELGLDLGTSMLHMVVQGTYCGLNVFYPLLRRCDSTQFTG